MLLSYIVTDVMSHVCILCWQMLCLIIMIWQMLLPMFETVVISHSLICGRCCKPLWQMEMPLYCFGYHSRLMLLPYHVLADVIAFALVLDVKTTTVS